MAKPLDSVIALARFSLTEKEQQHAGDLLQQVSDWNSWLRQIELHALSGFATQHIEEYDLPVPPETKIALRALNIRHRSAAQARYIALREIDTVFQQHDIPYLGLKGVCLMPLIYDKPELRPMRDMDLLIPQDKEQLAVQCMREIGFEMLDEEDNKFMRKAHQLPNATKKVNGFTISVELHRDSYSRDTPGTLQFPSKADSQQQIQWQGLDITAFEDKLMLDQVSRHMEGTHPNELLKLINVMDVVGLAERILQRGNWQSLVDKYPNIINTLYCIHGYTPLPNSLTTVLNKLPTKTPDRIGEVMVSLRSSITAKNMPLKTRFKRLFLPSDWWLHLYYNVHPDKSLFWVKAVRHPARIVSWLFNRALSRIRGG